MWKILRKINPVWYFDATGNIIADVPGQGKNYWYTISTRDNINNKIISVADFSTNIHSVLNITKFLMHIRLNLKYGVKTPFNVAPLIVVDQSMALIVSVLLIFNSTDLTTYLNWAYQYIYLFDDDNKVVPPTYDTRVILCSSHLLKNIVSKTKKILKTKKNNNKEKENEKKKAEKEAENKKRKIMRLFLKSFTLLQNTTRSNEFDEILCLIQNIFCHEFHSQIVNTSIDLIKLKSLEKNLSLENILSELDCSSKEGESVKISVSISFSQF